MLGIKSRVYLKSYTSISQVLTKFTFRHIIKTTYAYKQ